MLTSFYSLWIYAICYRHGNTKNPELASFFARCSHLFRLPILPLFVFDGPARPDTKRGKVIRGNNHWLVADMKAMLRGFGFPWVEVGSYLQTLQIATYFFAGTWRGRGRVSINV
jgi:hypothetical protein